MAVMTALLLAGCAVGPNYKRPAVAVPDQYAGAAADAASLADKKWSDLFRRRAPATGRDGARSITSILESLPSACWRPAPSSTSRVRTSFPT